MPRKTPSTRQGARGLTAGRRDPGFPELPLALAAPLGNRLGRQRLVEARTFAPTPEEGFTGEDSFAYLVSDGLSSDEGRVSVAVRPKPGLLDPATPPTANDDLARTVEGRGVSVDVIANDTDFDDTRQQLGLASNTEPQHGTVACSEGGTCTYKNEPGFTGTDSFGYQVEDKDGNRDGATVTITVSPKPESEPAFAPDARNDRVKAGSGEREGFGVLGNDRRGTGGELRLVSNTEPRHGTVRCSASGRCVYEGDEGFSGRDSFRYIAANSAGSDAGVVFVRVERARAERCTREEVRAGGVAIYDGCRRDARVVTDGARVGGNR